MNFTELMSYPYFPYAAGGIVGLLIGWLFTRIGWRRRIHQAEERVAELESTRRRTERESADAIEQTNRLRRTAQTAEEQLAELRSKVSALEADLTTAQEQKTAAEVSLEAHAGETADLKMQLAAQQEELEAARSAPPVNLEDAAPSPQQTALVAEVERLHQELSLARARAEKADQAAINKDTALVEAYARAVFLQRQSEEREAKLAAAQTELEKLHHEVAGLSNIKEEMESRIQRARADAAGELAALTSTMMKLKDDALSQANARIAELAKELEQARVAK